MSMMIVQMIIAVLLALLAVAGVPACAQTHVCPDGCDYRNIQAAIDSADPGDTIVIESATYPEDLITGKSIILHGLDTGKGLPVLTGMVTMAAEEAVLQGFDFAASNESNNSCRLNVVGKVRIYLNNLPGSMAVCPESSGFWNSSQPINYQFESRVMRSRMGNYWADYSGKDEDNNGIGDEPKVIDAMNVDYYPLMQPVESYRTSGEKEDRMELIRARLNEPFTIALKSNPTTGYKWYADYDYYLLNLQEERYDREPTIALGAGGSSVFVFLPLKTGKTTISLVYKRPWENIVADTKTFYVEITT